MGHRELYICCLNVSTGGSGLTSKPTSPTGSGGAFPGTGSPGRPSPQHAAAGGWQSSPAFPSRQPGGSSPRSPYQQQAKPASTTHSSLQNRPNYNVSFSGMGGASPGKQPAGVGECCSAENQPHQVVMGMEEQDRGMGAVC